MPAIPGIAGIPSIAGILRRQRRPSNGRGHAHRWQGHARQAPCVRAARVHAAHGSNDVRTAHSTGLCGS
eukprot:4888548-Prymnesium_polylepis.1